MGSVSIDVPEDAAPVIASVKVAAFSAAQYVKDFMSVPMGKYFPNTKFIEVRYAASHFRGYVHTHDTSRAFFPFAANCCRWPDGAAAAAEAP